MTKRKEISYVTSEIGFPLPDVGGFPAPILCSTRLPEDHLMLLGFDGKIQRLEGRPLKPIPYRVEVFSGRKGHFWRVRYGNGQKAITSESYTRKADARKVAKRFAQACGLPLKEIG